MSAGSTGPYRQSLRREVYAGLAARLLEAGELYEAYSTNERFPRPRNGSESPTSHRSSVTCHT
jgi:glutamyl-tRNA synthetase